MLTGRAAGFVAPIERAAAPTTELVLVYGSTEAEPIAHIAAGTLADADREAMRTGAGLLVGPPSPGVRVRIIDDEIVVTGDHVNKGYLDPADDATTKLTLDGETWHRTGDAGRLDTQGRLWLLGRLSARCGPIFPFAAETAARSWPGVRQAALVRMGERAVLAIAGDDGQQGVWVAEARRLGEVTVVPVGEIPLDRRHRSKVDDAALRRLCAGRG